MPFERHTESRSSDQASLICQGDYWTISYQNRVTQLRDSKGLRQLAHLLQNPDREIHVFDLTALTDPWESSFSAQIDARDKAQLSVRRAPDADGEAVLDPTARAACKERIAELREELDDAREIARATGSGLRNTDRVAELTDEIDSITRELYSSLGLKGRSRRLGSSAAEQARVNVARNISRALSQIEASNENLGRLLRSTIKTGTFCSYEPDPRFPVRWAFEPDFSPTASELVPASAGVASNVEPETALDDRESPVTTPRQSSRKWRAVVVTAAVGAIALAAIALGVARWRSMAGRSVASRRIRSIAVLPLENLSGDPAQEYFADGMTDELITDLAKITSLRVISRTSVMLYKGEHHQPLSEIAKALKVNAVVEGSAMRIGNRVRITAQLIDAADDKHLWAETYERDSRDVLALQDDVASAIAREVDAHLTPDERARLTSARPVNPEAYEAYLLGRYYFAKDTRDGRAKARQSFQRAIDIDPNFALGYASLSDCVWESTDKDLPCTEALPKAKELAEKALQLDDSLAEAHAALGGVTLVRDYDWASAEKELKRAIALNPGSARAHEDYGWLLSLQQRPSYEIAAQYTQAFTLDPLNPLYIVYSCNKLNSQGRPQEAIAAARTALEIEPNYWNAHSCIGAAYRLMGKDAESIAEYEKAASLEPVPLAISQLGYQYAISGRFEQARKVLAELIQLSRKSYVAPSLLATVYVGLGDKEQALRLLEKAYEERSCFLLSIKVDPIWTLLRSEPRFIALLKKTGLEK
jgi:TolB-like protein/Tfp pilus assembly protein PilF